MLIFVSYICFVFTFHIYIDLIIIKGIINMNSHSLEQLESLLTAYIGEKFVDFFESAKNIFNLRSTYMSLKQEEDVCVFVITFF